jgi:hypothetical protein
MRVIAEVTAGNSGFQDSKRSSPRLSAFKPSGDFVGDARTARCAGGSFTGTGPNGRWPLEAGPHSRRK